MYRVSVFFLFFLDGLTLRTVTILSGLFTSEFKDIQKYTSINTGDTENVRP